MKTLQKVWSQSLGSDQETDTNTEIILTINYFNYVKLY